jgi:hypothetical protein
MNYEKVIVELLSRIQVLEEQMAELLKTQSKTPKATTEDIRNHIQELKIKARASGEKVLVLRSGDIHKELGLKNAMPQVCDAMWQIKKEDDLVLHTTPSGKSSTIKIQYNL